MIRPSNGAKLRKHFDRASTIYGPRLNEENSQACLKIMYLPYLVIAHFKSEVAKSTNHCKFKIVAKSQKCKFLTHYFTTSPGEGGRRGVRNKSRTCCARLLPQGTLHLPKT